MPVNSTSPLSGDLSGPQSDAVCVCVCVTPKLIQTASFLSYVDREV